MKKILLAILLLVLASFVYGFIDCTECSVNKDYYLNYDDGTNTLNSTAVAGDYLTSKGWSDQANCQQKGECTYADTYTSLNGGVHINITQNGSSRGVSKTINYFPGYKGLIGWYAMIPSFPGSSNAGVRINRGANPEYLWLGVYDDVGDATSVYCRINNSWNDTGKDMTAGEWYFFYINFTANDIRFYFNGTQVCAKDQDRQALDAVYLLVNGAGSIAIDQFMMTTNDTDTFPKSTPALSNCTKLAGYTTNATTLNLSFYDLDDVPLNLNASITILYNVSSNYSQTMYNISSYQFCVYPDNAVLNTNITLQYQYGDDYFNYYTSNTLLNSITKSLKFYVETGSTITATIFDNTNSRVEGAYIHVLRYDFDSGNYLLVGQAQTNFEGEAKLYLVQDSVYYKFLIYYPIDELVFTSSPTYIYDDSIEFIINIYDEVLEDYYTLRDLDYSFAFNNLTDNFRFEYSDTSATIDGGCVKVWKTSSKQTTLVNESCTYTTSGTILRKIARVNDTSYLGKAYIIIDGELELVDSVSVRFFGANATGLFGVFIVLILTLMFGFIFTQSIALGVVAVPLPIVFGAASGLISLDIQVALSLQLIAIIIAIFINRN